MRKAFLVAWPYFMGLAGGATGALLVFLFHMGVWSEISAGWAAAFASFSAAAAALYIAWNTANRDRRDRRRQFNATAGHAFALTKMLFNGLRANPTGEVKVRQVITTLRNAEGAVHNAVTLPYIGDDLILIDALNLRTALRYMISDIEPFAGGGSRKITSFSTYWLKELEPMLDEGRERLRQAPGDVGDDDATDDEPHFIDPKSGKA